MIDHAILDTQAFHVLTANIQDELDARQHLLCAAQVRHRLNLTRIYAQRLQKQALTVTRHRGMPQRHQRVTRLINRQRGVKLGQRTLGATQHIALVGSVGGPQQLTALANERSLEGGRAGVNSQKRRTAIVGQRAALHALGVMALLKLSVFIFACKQRGKAHDLRALHITQTLKALQHIKQALRRMGSRRCTRDGATRRHEQVRVIRHDDVLLVKFQRLVESLAQLGQILQRAAQKCHMTPNGTSARQAGDGLRDHRLEDGGRDILPTRALVQKRLHVSLSEHAATRCDGVNGGMALRQLVQATRISIQQRGHLVDERTCAARARAVHALLDAVVEVDDLRVLAAQLNGNVGRGNKRLNGSLGGNDLLHEFNVKPLREQQAARSGNGDTHALRRICLSSLAQHLHDSSAHVCVMTAVNGPLNLVQSVKHRKLHRGRTHVDAQMQINLRRVLVHESLRHLVRLRRCGARNSLAPTRTVLAHCPILLVHNAPTTAQSSRPV